MEKMCEEAFLEKKRKISENGGKPLKVVIDDYFWRGLGEAGGGRGGGGSNSWMTFDEQIVLKRQVLFFLQIFLYTLS